MTDAAALLAAYDDQLRTDAEVPGAASVARHGPLRLAVYAGGRGFVTYRDLDGAGAAAVRRLVGEVLAHFRADPGVDRVEWKTRGHDRAPGLHEALVENGFVPGRSSTATPRRARARSWSAPVWCRSRRRRPTGGGAAA